MFVYKGMGGEREPGSHWVKDTELWLVMQDEHEDEGHALRMLGKEAQRNTISDDK